MRLAKVSFREYYLTLKKMMIAKDILKIIYAYLFFVNFSYLSREKLAFKKLFIFNSQCFWSIQHQTNERIN